MSKVRAFTIKQVAEQTGISEDTIRYYERLCCCLGQNGKKTDIASIKRGHL
ncbi:MerR family DNA-binding transcriptional regulator [Paenibacillus campinasensis]|uniref:MerR family DNA-binding transcriptional regulator n=1 Tax=Paenibacillus campinasensis TaxID=66347 RepID=UPI003145119D